MTPEEIRKMRGSDAVTSQQRFNLIVELAVEAVAQLAELNQRLKDCTAAIQEIADAQ